MVDAFLEEKIDRRSNPGSNANLVENEKKINSKTFKNLTLFST